jgi:hypothetical protein
MIGNNNLIGDLFPSVRLNYLWPLASLLGLVNRLWRRYTGARLEDADYEGHSLSMLARIAAALDRKLEIKMIPSKEVEESVSGWMDREDKIAIAWTTDTRLV